MTMAMHLSSLWLATALALTTATQLRPGDLPVGPGEVMLALWGGGAAIAVLSRKCASRPAVGRVLLAFWVGGAVLLFAGRIVALTVQTRPEAAYRDLLAYLLAALVMLLFTALPGLDHRTQRATQYLVPLTVGPLFVLMLLFRHSPEVGPLQLSAAGIRFLGWAKNPNQTALTVVMVPFVCLHLAAESTRFRGRAWYLVLTAGALAVGVATLSDALAFAWSTGAVATVCLLWYRLATDRDVERRWAVLAHVGFPLMLLSIGVVVGPPLYHHLQETILGVYGAEGAQGSLRLLLWRHGIEAILASPVCGWGPGAHAGIPGPFMGFESHNTFIDWGTCTGVPGALGLVALLWWVARRAWRGRNVYLNGGIVAVTMFGLLHHVLRHPLFWFYLIACAVLGQQSARDEPCSQVRGRRATLTAPQSDQ